MLDRYLHPLLKPPLQNIARIVSRAGVNADQVTVWGFAVGLIAVPLIVLNQYVLALLCIVVNRLADGIDGELARLGTPSDAGGFLDITLDFIFYQAIVFAFGLADPANALWALLLMLSFVGTGVSFLAFCHRQCKTDPLGVRTISWTGLYRDSKIGSVFHGAK